MASRECPGFYPIGVWLDCLISFLPSMDLDFAQVDVFLFAKVPGNDASVLKVDIFAVETNPASCHVLIERRLEKVLGGVLCVMKCWKCAYAGDENSILAAILVM